MVMHDTKTKRMQFFIATFSYEVMFNMMMIKDYKHHIFIVTLNLILSIFIALEF